jgi:hypothetical protein
VRYLGKNIVVPDQRALFRSIPFIKIYINLNSDKDSGPPKINLYESERQYMHEETTAAMKNM